jgi:hypothetical protein
VLAPVVVIRDRGRLAVVVLLLVVVAGGRTGTSTVVALNLVFVGPLGRWC